MQLVDLLSSDLGAPASGSPADALRPVLEGLLDAAALPVKGLLASGGHDLHAALLHLPLAGEPAPLAARLRLRALALALAF